MASPLAYQNLITAASISSPDSWTTTAPLVNCTTPQLAEQAVRTASGSTEIRCNFGEMHTVGCIAVLNHNFAAASGSMSVRVLASPGPMEAEEDAAYDFTITSSAAFREAIGIPHTIHFPTAGMSVWSIWFQITGGTLAVPFRLGGLWAGPCFRQVGSQEIEEVAPPIDGDWSTPLTEAPQRSKSRGRQAYPRRRVQVQSLRCRYGGLDLAQARGSASSSNPSLKQIIRLVGNDSPMIMVARTKNLAGEVDSFVTHDHMVYGAQVLPWDMKHTGGDKYAVEMQFEGEN